MINCLWLPSAAFRSVVTSFSAGSIASTDSATSAMIEPIKATKLSETSGRLDEEVVKVILERPPEPAAVSGYPNTVIPIADYSAA